MQIPTTELLSQHHRWGQELCTHTRLLSLSLELITLIGTASVLLSDLNFGLSCVDSLLVKQTPVTSCSPSSSHSRAFLPPRANYAFWSETVSYRTLAPNPRVTPRGSLNKYTLGSVTFKSAHGVSSKWLSIRLCHTAKRDPSQISVQNTPHTFPPPTLLWSCLLHLVWLSPSPTPSGAVTAL